LEAAPSSPSTARRPLLRSQAVTSARRSAPMVALVQVALNGAAPQDRETFVLHALEGFTVDEIAAITDRSREEIEQSIARARDHLRNGFAAINPFQRKLLQTTAIR